MMAREKGITGRAIASFVVEKDGSISEIEIVHGLCNKIGQEMIRTIKKMPNWTPGISDGKPIRARFQLPFTFKLS